MVTGDLGRRARKKHFSTRDRLGERPNPVVSEAKGKERRTKTETAIKLSPNVNVPEDKACSFTHDPTEKGKGGNKRQICPSISRCKSSDTNDIERESDTVDDTAVSYFEGKFDKRSVSIGILLKICHRKGICNAGRKCVTTTKRRQGHIPSLSPLLLVMREETRRKRVKTQRNQFFKERPKRSR